MNIRIVVSAQIHCNTLLVDWNPGQAACSSGIALGKEKRGRKILEEGKGLGWRLKDGDGSGGGRSSQLLLYPVTEKSLIILSFHKKRALLNFGK